MEEVFGADVEAAGDTFRCLAVIDYLVVLWLKNALASHGVAWRYSCR